jgi:hypothetical protein
MANHGTEELWICAIGGSAERIVDEGGYRGEEFRVEFVDWREGISNRPNSGECFGEVLLDSEYLGSLKSGGSCSTLPQIRTLDKENPE